MTLTLCVSALAVRSLPSLCMFHLGLFYNASYLFPVSLRSLGDLPRSFPCHSRSSSVPPFFYTSVSSFFFFISALFLFHLIPCNIAIIFPSSFSTSFQSLLLSHVILQSSTIRFNVSSSSSLHSLHFLSSPFSQCLFALVLLPRVNLPASSSWFFFLLVPSDKYLLLSLPSNSLYFFDNLEFLMLLVPI